VRIGVEEAVLQHHLDVHLDDGGDEDLQRQLSGGQALVQAVDAGAFDILEDQHTAPSERSHHLGHDDSGLRREIAPQDFRVAGLFPKVELARDPLRELGDDGCDRAGMVVGEQQIDQKQNAK
jgi:hypothetical protein